MPRNKVPRSTEIALRMEVLLTPLPAWMMGKTMIAAWLSGWQNGLFETGALFLYAVLMAMPVLFSLVLYILQGSNFNNFAFRNWSDVLLIGSFLTAMATAGELFFRYQRFTFTGGSWTALDIILTIDILLLIIANLCIIVSALRLFFRARKGD